MCNKECKTCAIFKAKEKEVLNTYNSAYDCTIEMMFFVEECKKELKK